MPKRKRFVFYVQHLSGSGHFVRTYEIARALAAEHDVWLLDGGRPVPRPVVEHSFQLLHLPRIFRQNGELASWERQESIHEVMLMRRQKLHQQVAQIAPDVLVIEHFPFSKRRLRDEILSTIELAKIVNSKLRVYSSLRDIASPTQFDLHSSQYETQVVNTLNEYFDGLLVHADPRMFRLENHFHGMNRINVPVFYTGYVSEKPSHQPSKACSVPGPVIVSSGGVGGEELRACAVEAWARLLASGETGGRQLVVFEPLTTTDAPTAPKLEIDEDMIAFRPFASDFLDWMQRAELSISEAGYNTCANILETRTRSILVPNAMTSDQCSRARRFAENKLATLIEPRNLCPQLLAETIRLALSSLPPEHNIDLNGAHQTLKILSTAG